MHEVTLLDGGMGGELIRRGAAAPQGASPFLVLSGGRRGVASWVLARGTDGNAIAQIRDRWRNVHDRI